jgi:hypothetical protein
MAEYVAKSIAVLLVVFVLAARVFADFVVNVGEV